MLLLANAREAATPARRPTSSFRTSSARKIPCPRATGSVPAWTDAVANRSRPSSRMRYGVCDATPTTPPSSSATAIKRGGVGFPSNHQSNSSALSPPPSRVSRSSRT